jgi:hypothetical protein
MQLFFAKGILRAENENTVYGVAEFGGLILMTV